MADFNSINALFHINYSKMRAVKDRHRRTIADQDTFDLFLGHLQSFFQQFNDGELSHECISDYRARMNALAALISESEVAYYYKKYPQKGEQSASQAADSHHNPARLESFHDIRKRLPNWVDRDCLGSNTQSELALKYQFVRAALLGAEEVVAEHLLFQEEQKQAITARTI
jgi:hypothetical protein